MKKRLIDTLRKPIPKPTQVHQSKKKKRIDKIAKRDLDNHTDSRSEFPAEIVHLLPDNQRKTLNQLSQYCMDHLVIIELFNKPYWWDPKKQKWVCMLYDV